MIRPSIHASGAFPQCIARNALQNMFGFVYAAKFPVGTVKVIMVKTPENA